MLALLCCHEGYHGRKCGGGEWVRCPGEKQPRSPYSDQGKPLGQPKQSSLTQDREKNLKHLLLLTMDTESAHSHGQTGPHTQPGPGHSTRAPLCSWGAQLVGTGSRDNSFPLCLGAHGVGRGQGRTCNDDFHSFLIKRLVCSAFHEHSKEATQPFPFPC